MASLEPVYEQMRDDLSSIVPKMDPALIVKIMNIEKRLQEGLPPHTPHVHLYVYYKEGVKLHQKQEYLRDNYPLQVAVSRWNDGVLVTGLMDIQTVQSICSDSDIVKVKGDANAYMY